MKMMNNKTSLALAMAACLGGISPQALAIVKLSDSTAKPAATANGVGGPVLFAAEQTGEASLGLANFYATEKEVADGDLTVWLDKMPSAYAVTGIKTLYVQVTLTGGAKFYAEPKLVCTNNANGTVATFAGLTHDDTKVNVASAANNATEISASKSLILSANTIAAGKATATFNVLSGLTTTDSACLLTFSHTATNTAGNNGPGLTAYTVGARQDIGMNVTVGYVQAGAPVTSTFSGTFIKFATALQSTITAAWQGAGLAASVTIDVKQASKKFVAGAGATVDALIGLLGSVTITSAGAIRLSTTSAAESTANLIMSSGSVTVAGALLAGVASVHAYSGTLCANEEVANATLTVSSGSGGSTNSITLAGISVTALRGGVDICVKVDGKKTLNNGLITASLAGVGTTNFTPTFGDGNFVNVGINGSRVRVLNIPAATNIDQAFIRFYNTSSQNAVIRGTLYGQDGKVLGTENSTLFDPLKPYSVEVLDSTKLALKVGTESKWTGKAWLLIQAELDSALFKVQAMVVRPSAGSAVNLSSDALN